MSGVEIPEEALIAILTDDEAGQAVESIRRSEDPETLDEAVEWFLQVAYPHLRAAWEEELLSDEAIEAVARLMYRYGGMEAAEGGPWEGFHPEGQEGLRIGARMHIQAALASYPRRERC